MRAKASERRELLSQSRACGIAVAVFASFAFALWIAQGAETAQVKLSEANQAKIEAIRRAGEPTTLAELNKWYPTPPSEQNAAFIYTNAFAALSSVGPQAPTFLLSNQKPLALLHQAASLAQSRYPVDLNQGPQTLLPHLGSLKTSADLLQNEAVAAAFQGQTEQATKSVLAGFALAGSLDQEPVVISQLVRVVAIERAVTGLESLLNRQALSQEQLSRISAALRTAEANNTTSAVRSLIGERCTGIVCFCDPAKGIEMFREADPSSDAQIMKMMEGHLKGVSGQKDLGFYLDHLNTLIAAVKIPGTNSLAVARKCDAELAQVKTTNVFAFPVSEAILPALATVPKKSQQALADLRIAQAALAVERFRLTHGGQTPHSLNELVPQYLPAVPQDPFSDAPLRYRQNIPKGYTVYSFGPDQQDDGGTHKPLKVLNNSVYDLAFTVSR